MGVGYYTVICDVHLLCTRTQGYSRKGLALFKLNRLQEAEDAYTAGLKVDPENTMLKDGLDEILSRQSE